MSIDFWLPLWYNIIKIRGAGTPPQTAEREKKMGKGYTMKHIFEVNGRVEYIEADGLQMALEHAERKFGKGVAEYKGIKLF